MVHGLHYPISNSVFENLLLTIVDNAAAVTLPRAKTSPIAGETQN